MRTLFVIVLVLAGAAMALHIVEHMREASGAASVRQGTAADDWGNHKGFDNQHPACQDKNACPNAFRGGDAADTIYGKDGMDWGATNDGNDVIYGGGGMDQPYGSCGNDRIFGEQGHDHLFGDGQACKDSRGGDDYLSSEDGRDERNHIETIDPGAGRDICVMDEDPDGIAISPSMCEVLTLKDIKGYSGPTPIFRYFDAKRGHDHAKGELRGPGIYKNVGE